MRGFGSTPPVMPHRATPSHAPSPTGSPTTSSTTPTTRSQHLHSMGAVPGTAPSRAAARTQQVGGGALQRVQSIRQGANRATTNQVAATQHFARTGVQTPAAPAAPATVTPQPAVPATVPGRPAAGER